MRDQERETFAVPVTSGLAPESIILSQPNLEVAILVEDLGLATDVLVKRRVLREGGTESVATDWIDSGLDDITAVGLTTWTGVSGFPVKIECDSGGTAGDVVISAKSWY